MKALGVNGLKVNDSIAWPFIVKGKRFTIQFLPTEEFFQIEAKDCINSKCLEGCDSVVLVYYAGSGNNTLEVQMLKKAVSILYFAKRLEVSDRRIKSLEKEEIKNIDLYHDYFTNYHINGFFDEDGIVTATWHVKIGNRRPTKDDYERYLTRAFSTDRLDEYERQTNPKFEVQSLNICDAYISKIDMILQKMHKNDSMSSKLETAFKLYFETLCDFKNPEYTVMSYATILETLLLGADEDKQRKKASARVACLVCDELSFSRKRFVADHVYYFYKYRNGIVHDGKGILDFEDEIAFNQIMYSVKHIIFCIIKYIIEHDIKSVDEIKKVVEKNVTIDEGVTEGFDYIDLDYYNNNPDAGVLLVYDEGEDGYYL